MLLDTFVASFVATILLFFVSVLVSNDHPNSRVKYVSVTALMGSIAVLIICSAIFIYLIFIEPGQ